MKRLFITLVLILTRVVLLAQQDPLYNQYFFNPLVINPAYAGIHGFSTVTLISRAQYLGMDGAPITNNLSFHTSFWDNRAGIGFMVVNDRLGVNNNFEFILPYSYTVDFEKVKVSVGMQGSYSVFRYDYSKLTLEYLDDETFSQANEGFEEPNFGLGVMVHSDLFFAGFSIPRILDVEVNDGVVSSTRYRRHFYTTGGVVLPFIDFMKIKPSFLLKFVEGTPTSVDLNVSVLFLEVLWAGISVRNLNTFGANAQLELSDRFRLGYSFELPGNALVRSTFGTHEIMLAVDFAVIRSQFVKRRYF